MDQAAERYLKKLRRALVCSKKDRERLLADAKDLLENFAQENPGAFYQDYISSFGRPEDFAGEMLSGLDPEDVQEAKLRQKRALIGIVAAAAAVLVLLMGIWLGQRSQSPVAAVTPTPAPTATPTAEPSSAPSTEPTPTSGPVTYVERVFSDCTDITHKEAVGTVLALGLISGKEDGSYFDPEGTVTRAECAKIIAVMMNGGGEVNTGVKEEPSFSDISGHWAESWIEYCADMGIVGPWDSKEMWENKTFDPNGLATSLDLLRMCLTALGYDAEVYRLNGGGWQAQTLERARNTSGRKLTEGLDEVDLNLPITRDVAAQILYNTLQATVVTARPDKNTNTSEVTWKFSTEGNDSLLHQRFSLKSLNDIVYE